MIDISLFISISKSFWSIPIHLGYLAVICNIWALLLKKVQGYVSSHFKAKVILFLYNLLWIRGLILVRFAIPVERKSAVSNVIATFINPQQSIIDTIVPASLSNTDFPVVFILFAGTVLLDSLAAILLYCWGKAFFDSWLPYAEALKVEEKTYVEASEQIVDGPVFELFLEVKRNLHIRRFIELYSVQQSCSPCTLGFLKPKVFVPGRLLIMLDPDTKIGRAKLELVFRHELSHHRRLDVLMLHIRTLACAFQRFNRYINNDDLFIFWKKNIEFACDDIVMKGKSPAYLTTYEKLLAYVSLTMTESPAKVRLAFAQCETLERTKYLHKSNLIPFKWWMGLIFLTVFGMSVITRPGASPVLFNAGQISVMSGNIHDINENIVSTPSGIKVDIAYPVQNPEEIIVHNTFKLNPDMVVNRLLFTSSIDTPVLSPINGTITRIGRFQDNAQLGNVVEIQNEYLCIQIGHISPIDLNIGDSVKLAQVIGKIDDSGMATKIGSELILEDIEHNPISITEFTNRYTNLSV